MTASSLQDLYNQKLQLMLDAERQITQALPQMAQAVQNDQLRAALEKHNHETAQHVERLQQLIRTRDQSVSGAAHCQSMRALIQDAQTTLPTIKDPDTIDAFVIAAQGVEHHEIAAYGTARAWARQLGYDDDADLLQETLDEESNADQTLTGIAEQSVNEQASQSSSTRDRPVNVRSGGQGDRASTGGSSSTRPASSDVSVSRGADQR